MRKSPYGWAPSTGDAGSDGSLSGYYDPGADPLAIASVTASADASSSASNDSVLSAGIVHPVTPSGYVEDQLDGYTYGATTVYGSNVFAAWRYSTGLDTSIALIDDGFDLVSTQPYGDFPTALSRNYGVGSPSDIAEVTNNSWAFGGYGVGEPTDPDFGS